MKGERQARTWKGLSNRPRKGCLDLARARRRRQASLEGSPTRVNGLEAEPKSRLLLKGRTKKEEGPILMGQDRSGDPKEIFECGDCGGDPDARTDELEHVAEVEGD